MYNKNVSFSDNLLQVEDLCKDFPNNSGSWFNKHFFAVKDVSFSLKEKMTLAIVGENGSGKSTLAKMLVGITQPTSGKILFKNQPLSYGDYHFRAKHIRMLFQDPDASFNSRLNVGQTLDLPLRLATELSLEERDQKIFHTLRLVGFSPEHVQVKLNQLTVSQKQRIALARALILEPEIIIIDDALNTLDTSVRLQLTNLMLELQEKLGIAYIYIGQHMGIIKHIADDILVLSEGQMIEYGKTQNVLKEPKSDITKRLIQSHFGKLLDHNAWQNE